MKKKTVQVDEFKDATFHKGILQWKLSNSESTACLYLTTKLSFECSSTDLNFSAIKRTLAEDINNSPEHLYHSLSFRILITKEILNR